MRFLTEGGIGATIRKCAIVAIVAIGFMQINVSPASAASCGSCGGSEGGGCICVADGEIISQAGYECDGFLGAGCDTCCLEPDQQCAFGEETLNNHRLDGGNC